MSSGRIIDIDRARRTLVYVNSDMPTHQALHALRTIGTADDLLGSPDAGWTPERARRLAEIAHAGQLDKAGSPYIGHPARVVVHARGSARGVDSADVEMVAWLHDVLEDTPVTAAHLRAARMPEHLVTALALLDHSDERSYGDYVDDVSTDPLARAVKLADLTDNLDPPRLARLEPSIRERLEAKYGAAHARLAAMDDGDWTR